MDNFRTVSAILRGVWAIEPNEAAKLMPLVVGMLKGNGNAGLMTHIRSSYGDGQDEQFNMNPENRIQFAVVGDGGIGMTKGWTTGEAPMGSVAIVPVSGPITKADNCGDPGSETIAAWINQLQANSNVKATILMMDSPGGQVSGLNLVREAVKNHSKPIYGYVNDGFAASAAYYMISGTDGIFVNNATDIVGSIGTTMTYMNFDEYLKNEGIVMKDLYAPQSTQKNKEFRDAAAGDYTGIESMLGVFAQDFIDHVQATRGSKLTSDTWKNGATFYAKDAIEIGLIDGIMPLAELVAKANTESATTKLYV